MGYHFLLVVSNNHDSVWHRYRYVTHLQCIREWLWPTEVLRFRKIIEITSHVRCQNFDETWNDRVVGVPAHANPCGAAKTWVVWANTWKTRVVVYLFFIFFKFINFLLYTSARAEPAHVDRFWRSIRHMTCFRPRMCLLRVSFILLPFWG